MERLMKVETLRLFLSHSKCWRFEQSSDGLQGNLKVTDVGDLSFPIDDGGCRDRVNSEGLSRFAQTILSRSRVIDRDRKRQLLFVHEFFQVLVGVAGVVDPDDADLILGKELCGVPDLIRHLVARTAPDCRKSDEDNLPCDRR